MFDHNESIGEIDDFSFDSIRGSNEEPTQQNITSGAGITRNSMNLVFLLDTSGSMGFGGGQRINQLNTAMPIALAAARDAAMEMETELFVRIISFNNSASWVMGSATQSVPIDDACSSWRNLSATGGTDTAGAIRLACEAMHTRYLGTRNYHPVVILITDGESNDPNETRAAIGELRKALSSGNSNKMDKVWRIAIGVENYNEPELLDFAMTGKIEDEYGNEKENVPMVFKVDNVSDLTKVLKTVTVSSLYSSNNAGTDDHDKDSEPVVPIINI